ncbi:hypothetical protein MFIFM68171_07449 [Madurella fahalii]|uniref:Uncharacterized protein n=1 Tax=Madurella fahalii TaxID=1157608 RepID=A0ABQ0GHL8_9PEZI
MASNALPAGAFLTTIQGRRCTAVPRASAATVSANRDTQAVTVQSSAQATASPTTEAVAVAVGNADVNTADTSSTSTTSSSLVIFTSSTPLSRVASSAQVTQGRGSQSEPSALVPTPPPAALLPAAGATPQSFTAFADVTLSRETEQASVVQSSQTDGSVTVSAADVPATSTSPGLPEGPAATPLSTTIGSPEPSADSGTVDGAGTTSTNSAVSALPNVNSNAVQSTVAVAGGVIGGVVAISILAFFIWWWRRRRLRKRRSTLLTPLDAVPSFDRDEKGGYVINRGSIGPTPVTEKVKAALGQNFKRFRGHLRNKTGGSAPSVNLDRGTSQFMDLPSSHSRANSGISGPEVTTKDRFVDWWSRLTADMNFNWRLRNNTAGKDNMRAAAPLEKKPALGSQPDFLTLLNMDDQELDREAQRRRASISRKNGSASSTDNFLGGLNLNFGSSPSNDNPFSDANAIAHTSAQPAPLAINQPLNPFSDANAIRDPPPAAMPKPATYVADIRRSRGQSVSNNNNNTTTSRQPSTAYNYYTPSAGTAGTAGRDSVTSSATRNKFRSDPFDLEAKASSITSSMAGTTGSSSNSSNNNRASGGVGAGDVRRPGGAHMRSESFSSKYSSGISLGDWSDPGPDVGPGTGGGGGGGGKAGWPPEKRASPTQGWRDRLERERDRDTQPGPGAGGGGRRMSGGSEGRGVGKAM